MLAHFRLTPIGIFKLSTLPLRRSLYTNTVSGWQIISIFILHCALIVTLACLNLKGFSMGRKRTKCALLSRFTNSNAARLLLPTIVSGNTTKVSLMATRGGLELDVVDDVDKIEAEREVWLKLLLTLLLVLLLFMALFLLPSTLLVLCDSKDGRFVAIETFVVVLVDEHPMPESSNLHLNGLSDERGWVSLFVTRESICQVCENSPLCSRGKNSTWNRGIVILFRNILNSRSH